jgi:cytochrome c biogenesis protein CcmG, thiol:disulfide interchange protein DsbE
VTFIRFALVLLLFCSTAHAIKPGELAPDIAGVAMADGRPVKLSDLRGKVVYLDFWASWCVPCKLSLPRLQQMREELAPLGFEVLGVNLDHDEANARAALAAGATHYPMIRGVDPKVVERYEIIKMPGAYLVDREGVVRYSYQGFSETGFAAVRPIVEKLVGRPSGRLSP